VLCEKSQYRDSLVLYIEIGLDWRQTMNTPRPYVAVLLCEKVLQEKDGGITLVRIADRIHYSLQMMGGDFPQNIKPVIGLQGLLSVKSGPVTGDHVVEIVLEKPNGERKQVYSQSVNFLGGDHGQNILLNINLGVDQNGLYWFDVLFDGEVLSRAPLMVTPAPAQEQMVPST
jgi:hypothetical protein